MPSILAYNLWKCDGQTLIVILSVFILLVILQSVGYTNSLETVVLGNCPVPVNHPVYDLLDRVETRLQIDCYNNVRPLTRNEVLAILYTIPEEELSEVEYRELARYEEEFDIFKTALSDTRSSNLARVRSKYWANSPFYRDGYNLYNYNSGNFYCEVNPILYYGFSVDSTGDHLLQRTNGLKISAGYGGVSAYFDFRDNMESGRGPYNQNERHKLISGSVGYVTMEGREVCYYDITRAVISANLGNLIVGFGRNDIAWGSGRNGNLALSDYPPPYDMLTMRYNLDDKVRFSYMTGWLHPFPEIYQSVDTVSTGQVRKIIAGKYIAAHRVEIFPCSWMEMGISEMVVYGERGIEPAYLNPFNLYFSAEHNLGDMDNVSWAADVELKPVAGFKLYGEIFIDDMKTSKLGSDYFGNKFAYTGGCLIVDPIHIENADINLEYSRIDPFVYSHIFPINTYKNWDTGLGSLLQPNSDRLLIQLRWKPFYELSISLSSQFIRHGSNTDSLNVGGDINMPQSINQQGVAFLSGNRLDTTIHQLTCSWEPLEYLKLTGKLLWRNFQGGKGLEWKITTGVNVW